MSERKRQALGRGITEETQPAKLPGEFQTIFETLWPLGAPVGGTHETDGFVNLWRRYGAAGEPLVLQREGGRAWTILGQRAA